MKKTKGLRHLIVFLAALGLVVLWAVGAVALPPVNANKEGVAIKGYDPVAYFTKGMPVKGSEEFSHQWQGARWLFSSKEHRDLFVGDPEKYAPQYGGY